MDDGQYRLSSIVHRQIYTSHRTATITRSASALLADVGPQAPQLDINIGEFALNRDELFALRADEMRVWRDGLADAREHQLKLAAELAPHRPQQLLAQLNDPVVKLTLDLATLGRQQV